MKFLWMVLYAGTHVGGTWGPLPYDRAECERRAREGNQIVAEAQNKPEIIAKMKHMKASVPLRDWRFTCEEHTERPKLGIF